MTILLIISFIYILFEKIVVQYDNMELLSFEYLLNHQCQVLKIKKEVEKRGVFI